jgi:hypothetical protein
VSKEIPGGAPEVLVADAIPEEAPWARDDKLSRMGANLASRPKLADGERAILCSTRAMVAARSAC